MRTTLTLESDVARKIARIQKERGTGLNETVNGILRVGIAVQAKSPGDVADRAFVTESVSLGSPRLQNLDNITEVLAVAERIGLPGDSN